MKPCPILSYTTLIQFSHRMALLQQQAGKDELALRWLDFEAEVRHHSNNSGKVRRLDDNWTCDADIQDIVQELAPVPDRVLAPALVCYQRTVTTPPPGGHRIGFCLSA